MAAETLEELEPDDQRSVIENMDAERASEILEEMGPDEAADLLADLSEERARQILDLMETADADDVRELLSFPEDTAGGLMTTEYVAVSVGLSAQECIEACACSSRRPSTSTTSTSSTTRSTCSACCRCAT